MRQHKTVVIALENTRIILTVERDKSTTYGYCIRHNQPIGWQGITAETFAWYKLKRDAVREAEALMRSYNYSPFTI